MFSNENNYLNQSENQRNQQITQKNAFPKVIILNINVIFLIQRKKYSVRSCSQLLDSVKIGN
ncbi:hypothetical protein pb186bvf_002775 [Paramecium bursaria]